MLRLENLSKRYRDLIVLEAVNQVFPLTGLICLMGPSGSGKSSLLNVIAGFDTDYEGDVLVNGIRLKSLKPAELSAYRSSNIGFIFQNYNLLSSYTVMENILLACGNDVNRIPALKDYLSRFDLSEKIDEKVENLSGGQKQRVAIIRSLINNPSMILADEPTGSLDRENAKQIMNLLKEISKERLVILITHDIKLSAYADHSIKIENKNLVGMETVIVDETQEVLNKEPKISKTNLGIKSFKVRFKPYISVALSIALGVAIFMMSLSSSTIIEQEMSAFKAKNTAYNNGYIKVEGDADPVLEKLKKDDRIIDVYKQYILSDIELTLLNQTQTMSEKYPMPKAKEEMSYGVMPLRGANEIALSPSLARKFSEDISELIGETLVLKHREKTLELKVSGVFNAAYDDLYLSSDVEVALYEKTQKDKPFAISFDVETFEDVVAVDDELREANISSVSAAKSVAVLITTFKNLSLLFTLVSALIFAVLLGIAITLMWKQQATRSKEIGLLSALGYSKQTLRKMIQTETLGLSLLTLVLNTTLIGILYQISTSIKLGLTITAVQIMLSALITVIAVLIIGSLCSRPLINKDPADALRN